MRFIHDWLQAMRKFHRIRLPITHFPKPAGIKIEQLNTELGRIANHMPHNNIVHVSPDGPSIIGGQWVCGIFPGILINQHLSNPVPEHIRGRLLRMVRGVWAMPRQPGVAAYPLPNRPYPFRH